MIERESERNSAGLRSPRGARELHRGRAEHVPGFTSSLPTTISRRVTEVPLLWNAALRAAHGPDLIVAPPSCDERASPL